MQVQGKDGVDQLKERMQSEGIGALYQGAVAQALATFVSVNMETIALVAFIIVTFSGLTYSRTMALVTLESFCPRWAITRTSWSSTTYQAICHCLRQTNSCSSS